MMRYSVASALLGLSASVYAAGQQSCPAGGICYQLSIPDATASSSSGGDIYMQITGPTTYSYIALGQGSQMSGSQIFVVYTSADGKNVTVSPRLASGHSMPQYNSAAQVTLLEGSGVSNGQMTANIKCTGCNSWSGGSMDFSGSSTSWIYAARAGSALNTDSKSASISQHSDTYGTLSFDASAKGGSSSNPFLAASSSSGGTVTSAAGASNTVTRRCGSTATSATTGAAGAASGSSAASATTTSAFAYYTARPSTKPTFTYGQYGPPSKRATDEDACIDDNGNIVYSSAGSSNSNTGSSSSASLNSFASSASYEKRQTILLAHGVMAALAFVALFPGGAIAVRLLNFKGLVAVHAGIQVLALLVYIIAFGMGVWIALQTHNITAYHPIIGIILLVLVLIQPILGVLHHKVYKQYQRRSVWSHAHIWLGRIVLTLGMINGGLGLMLAGATGSGPIAYIVIAVIVWLVWVAAIFIGERRKARAQPPKYSHALQDTRGSNTSSLQNEYYGVSHKG